MRKHSNSYYRNILRIWTLAIIMNTLYKSIRIFFRGFTFDVRGKTAKTTKIFIRSPQKIPVIQCIYHNRNITIIIYY